MTMLQPDRPVGFATCPLCHTMDDALTGDALATGGDWRCRTCGQAWTAARLATVEAYSAWVLARAVLILLILLVATSVSAADLGQYRDFRLGSSTAVVVKAAGSPGRDLKTLHSRPALLQEMSWRAPYTAAKAPAPVDPVGSMIFSFVDDQLYKIVVLYAQSRIEGLTTRDMTAALVATYGPFGPLPARPRGGDEALNSTVPVAQWRSGDSVVTLQHYQYSGSYELVITSLSLERLARKAQTTAAALDAREAPAREAADLKRQAEAEQEAAEKTRLTNKEAFRP